jgi:hypothetical protein
MTYPEYETENGEAGFDKDHWAVLLRDYSDWRLPSREWDPNVRAINEAMEAAARAVKEQPDIIRQRIRDHAKDYYSPEEFGRLANRGIGTVRGWISRRQIEAVRVAGKGPHGKLMIPGRELEKLFLGGLHVYVPPEVIDEELGPEGP